MVRVDEINGGRRVVADGVRNVMTPRRRFKREGFVIRSLFVCTLWNRDRSAGRALPGAAPRSMRDDSFSLMSVMSGIVVGPAP
jgi:hypothetical protein